MLSHRTAVGCGLEPALVCGSFARWHLPHPRNTQDLRVSDFGATTDLEDRSGIQGALYDAIGQPNLKPELATAGPHRCREGQDRTVRRDCKRACRAAARLGDESFG